jgi:hypothetical protein
MRILRVYFPLISLPVIIVLLAYKSGSPGGRSGSPGDNGSTCTSCHSGTAQIVTGWITTNVPISGYEAGQVYNISLNATNIRAARFGFELTAEDDDNKKIATFSITNVSETKLTNINRAVTHTSSGTTPSGNSKSWDFEWTAPLKSTGTITFYAAVNAADGNGNNSGDIIYKTSTAITPNSTRIGEYTNSLKFYPNPSTGLVNFETKIQSGSTDLLIININGQLVEHRILNSRVKQIDLSYLPKGIYYLKLSHEDNFEYQKLVLY